jgi:hypothetical protein
MPIFYLNNGGINLFNKFFGLAAVTVLLITGCSNPNSVEVIEIIDPNMGSGDVISQRPADFVEGEEPLDDGTPLEGTNVLDGSTEKNLVEKEPLNPILLNPINGGNILVSSSRFNVVEDVDGITSVTTHYVGAIDGNLLVVGLRSPKSCPAVINEVIENIQLGTLDLISSGSDVYPSCADEELTLYSYNLTLSKPVSSTLKVRFCDTSKQCFALG